MATKYNLTTAFTAIAETTGTIQNVGAESVELVSSTNAVAGEGIVLNPSEKRSFKGALSARSMGDAGAVVNVVDFTEAGEGGEEYDLPIASATTLGGIKISNSFTVANDGTLSIKKSGKTILGGVKSSDDEGKVTVNNDGTMTCNPLGYRQPSTTYEVGDIKYHSALPTGWYLECTTPGISGSGDLTISSSSLGYSINDGSVVWCIKNFILSFPNIDTDNGFSYSSGIADINTVNLSSIKMITYRKTKSGTENKPESESYGGILNIYNTQANTVVEKWTNSTTGNEFIRSMISGGDDIGKWNAWKQQEQIVAKSLSENGYIKYASGLIVQWGIFTVEPNSPSPLAVSLPISFSSAAKIITQQRSMNSASQYIQTNAYLANYSTINIYLKETVTVGDIIYSWLAIGY